MAQPERSTRRRFMQRAAASAAAATVLSSNSSGLEASTPQDYASLQSDEYLGEPRTLAKVTGRKVFTEGPAFSHQGRLYFTNVPLGQILQWDPKREKLSVYRENSHAANGLYFDRAGRMLACEGNAGRVTRTDLSTGKIEVLADNYRALSLAPPNDVCTDLQGRVYFTSRPGGQDPTKGNVNAVYRINLDGRVQQLLKWPDIHMPNGIVTSPDGKTLYVIEAHPDADRHRDIRAYDLDDDGLSNERVLIDFYPGRSGDGMCIDADGNLYVAAGLHKTRNTSETLDTRPGIHVISPQGKLLAFRGTPEDTVTNCTFGGKDLRTLYVTCGSVLLAIPTTIAGKPDYGPQK